MKNYRVIYLKASLVGFVREVLTSGHTLARYLLDTQPIEQGRVFTFVPHELEISEDDVYESIKHGGLLPVSPQQTHKKVPRGVFVPRPSTGNILEGILWDYLQRNANHVCVFEDFYARPSDPSMVSSDLPWVAANDEVYYYLNSSSERETLEKVIFNASDVYTGAIGILTLWSEQKPLNLSSGIITQNQLKSLAKNSKKIIIGAFDSEGYLIWEKDGG